MPLRGLFHVRRRGAVLRVGGLLVFVGLVCLWLKADQGKVPGADERINVIGKSVNSLTGDRMIEKPQVIDSEPGAHNLPGIIPGGNLNMLAESTFEEKLRAERLFALDDAKVVSGLGEGGRAAHISDEEAKKVDEIMKIEAFNRLLSDKISLNRTVPDSRDPLCKRLSYPGPLPTASVIIIFTNEAWTALLRTIHSVINRSPKHLLKEILLVDDFSDREELGEKLDLYIKYRLPPGLVRLYRLPERHGLIRARLEGAKVALGDVLIFLDSHCEANIKWMEPLLHRIKESRSAVLVPIIDVIDDKTMEYYAGNGRYFQVGGFTWSGHFTWIEISKAEERRRGSPVAPTRSPTMAGGLFAIDRKYFWEVGGYDEGMDVWGGENLEMSFRVWSCGGTLETIPCSRVGHIFRSFHPYTFPGNKDTHGLNTARMAEVWMDDYKRLFYMHRPELQSADWGDVTGRRELKVNLGCKSFKWYLDNVYPQKFILDEHSYAYGRLRNNATQPNMCIDTLQANEKNAYELGLYSCHNFEAASQYISLSHNGELRREDACATVTDTYSDVTERKVRMTKCHNFKGDQEWIMTKSGHLLHKQSNLCLDTANQSSMGHVIVKQCSSTPTQQWWFDHYNLVQK